MKRDEFQGEIAERTLLCGAGNEPNNPRSCWTTRRETVYGFAAYLGLHYGTVDQELLLRNEYLVAENRILREQINGRLLLLTEAPANAIAATANHCLIVPPWRGPRPAGV